MPNNSNALINDSEPELGLGMNGLDLASVSPQRQWTAYHQPTVSLANEIQEEYIQQMRGYMAAMQMLPPESALDRQVREHYNVMREEHHAAEERLEEQQLRSVHVQGRIEAQPINPMPIPAALPRQPQFEINWADFGLNTMPTKKAPNKIPERETMNHMSYTIHNHLAIAIKEERGTNAWMSIGRIIEERLIAKECLDNNSYDGLIYYKTHKGRYETMKLGRFIKRHILKESILPENIFQKCVEGLVNHFFPVCVMEIHSGNQITRNYENCVGGGSCMAGENAPKVDMYARNPKKFSQLIGKQNRDTGRAILFHMDDGYTMLGRIYCGSSYLTNTMKDYAEKKGWIYNDGYGLYRKGETVSSSDYDMTISEVEWREGGVPYMDDFECGNIESDNTLTLFWSNSGDYCLQCCSGMLRDGACCCCCDNGFDENDAYYDDNGDTWCPCCFSEHFHTCDECEETIHVDYVRVTCDGEVCESCHDNYYVTCVECAEDYHADNTTTLHSGGEVCSTCLKNEYVICEECEQYVKEVSLGEDDRELCEDCKELCYAETE
jgi:hypothetical protein